MNNQANGLEPSDLNDFAAKGIDPVTGQMRTPSERRASGPTTTQGPTGRAASPARPAAQPLGARGRKTSIAFRAIDTMHAHASPLAQIYPPLVVDDDIAENVETASTTPPSSSFAGASLAPTGPRRRLSSMHRFPPVDPNQGASTALRRFPTTTTNSSMGMVSGWRGHTSDRPMIASPSNVEEAQDEEVEPEVASHVVDEGDNHGNAQMARQLERIEDRQRRLEEMLTQILNNFSNH